MEILHQLIYKSTASNQFTEDLFSLNNFGFKLINVLDLFLNLHLQKFANTNEQQISPQMKLANSKNSFKIDIQNEDKTIAICLDQLASMCYALYLGQIIINDKNRSQTMISSSFFIIKQFKYS